MCSLLLCGLYQSVLSLCFLVVVCVYMCVTDGRNVTLLVVMLFVPVWLALKVSPSLSFSSVIFINCKQCMNTIT